MAESFVRFEIEGPVARLTLDRSARRNALTKAMLQQMTQFVCNAADNSQVRVIVLAAEGPVFCAGMDLAEMQQRDTEASGPEQWLKDSLVYHDLLLALLEAPQPALAVVQGPVLAGGVGLVLACDLVLAVEDAFFSLPEPKRGITASMVTPLLAFRSGAGHASHLLLSGQQVSVTTMFQRGVCHEVVAGEQLASATMTWIDSIMTGSPAALAASKRQIREAANVNLHEQLRHAAQQSAEARDSVDAREGLQAFLEKRMPNWGVD